MSQVEEGIIRERIVPERMALLIEVDEAIPLVLHCKIDHTAQVSALRSKFDHVDDSTVE